MQVFEVIIVFAPSEEFEKLIRKTYCSSRKVAEKYTKKYDKLFKELGLESIIRVYIEDKVIKEK